MNSRTSATSAPPPLPCKGRSCVSTTCSDLDFAILQSTFRLGKWGETLFLSTSRGIVHPNGTGQNNNDVCLFVGCLTSQQHASVSQGRICSYNFTCCHTEIEAADQTFYLTQSQYTDTGPTSPSADPITPGAWQGSRWSANV